MIEIRLERKNRYSVPPGRVSGKRGWYKYPFRNMKVGHTFTVTANIAERVRGAAYMYSKDNPGKKFEVHRIDDNNIRVYRTK